MKVNVKGSVNTIRSVKQETKEIKESVVKIENHMMHYNTGMLTLTNYVKVNLRRSFKALFFDGMNINRKMNYEEGILNNKLITTSVTYFFSYLRFR